METVVIVKCVICGKTKEIREGEIEKGNHPMCDSCFNPMVADHAEIN